MLVVWIRCLRLIGEDHIIFSEIEDRTLRYEAPSKTYSGNNKKPNKLMKMKKKLKEMRRISPVPTWTKLKLGLMAHF